MSTPQPPPEPPKEGATPATDTHGTTPHGVPDGMHEHEPSGLPNNDRHESETAVTKP